MRSFYISYLLLNRLNIKNIVVPIDMPYMSDWKDDFYDNGIQATDNNFDDDVYDDLLDVEMAIDKLKSFGLLSEVECDIIDMIGNGTITLSNKGLSIISKKYKKTRFWVITKLNRICNLLELVLGGKFTNEGFINYMMNKYNLTSSEIDILINKVYK